MSKSDQGPLLPQYCSPPQGNQSTAAGKRRLSEIDSNLLHLIDSGTQQEHHKQARTTCCSPSPVGSLPCGQKAAGDPPQTYLHQRPAAPKACRDSLQSPLPDQDEVADDGHAALDCQTEYPESEASLDESLAKVDHALSNPQAAEPLANRAHSPLHKLEGSNPTSSHLDLVVGPSCPFDLQIHSDQPSQSTRDYSDEAKQGEQWQSKEADHVPEFAPFPATQYPDIEDEYTLDVSEQPNRGTDPPHQPSEVMDAWAQCPHIQQGSPVREGAPASTEEPAQPNLHAAARQPSEGEREADACQTLPEALSPGLGRGSRKEEGAQQRQASSTGIQASTTQYPHLGDASAGLHPARQSQEAAADVHAICTAQDAHAGVSRYIQSAEQLGGKIDGGPEGPAATQYPDLDEEITSLPTVEHRDTLEIMAHREAGSSLEALPPGADGCEECTMGTQYPDIEEEDLPVPPTSPNPHSPAENTDRGVRPGAVLAAAQAVDRAPDTYSDFDAELDDFLAEQEMEIAGPMEDDMPDYDEEAAEEVEQQQPLRIDVESDMDAIMQQHADRNPAPEQRTVPAMHSWLRRDTPPKTRAPMNRQQARSMAEVVHPGLQLDAQEALEIASKQPQRFAWDVKGIILSVTGGDGERVYCPVLEEEMQCDVNPGKKTKCSRVNMLAKPISALLEEIETESYAAVLRDSAMQIDAEARQQAGVSTSGQTASNTQCSEQLWVDKYRPRAFLELLSDEQINREVLRWLKSWDKLVFGEARQSVKQRDQKGSGIPEHRLLLISGPPGLGKTTLAHVVASHCGYRPVEINASDDRSGSALHTRVTDASQMQAVMGSRQPNCVIIDEIDGAIGGAEGKSAISMLMRLVQGSTSSNEGQAKGTFTKKKGSGSQPLNRPLIAICNDLYAPALRPLRNIARIITFKQTQEDKLVVRLRMIAAKEKLQVDRQALIALAKKAACDVRSCLNTLQFLARQGRRVRTSDITSLNMGQKDLTKGAFGVWNELLTSRAGGRATTQTEGEQLFRMLSDFGDHELVLNGLHENMLSQRYLDTHMEHTCRLFHHMQAADAFMTATSRSMDFAFIAYLPAAMLGIRAVVAGPDRPQLQWPKSLGECSRKGAANRALLHGWLLDVCRSVYSHLTTRCAAQEVIPSLTHMLHRPIRAVASQLFTANEQANMQSMVSMLITYNFTFDLAPLEAAEDAAPLMLKPEIHSVCSFPSFAVKQRCISHAVRQLIVHQAELKRLRRKSIVDEPSSQEQQRKGASASDHGSQARPESASNKLLYSVAQRAEKAGVVGKKPARKTNWLEKIREKKEQRKPSALQKQATNSASTAGTAGKSQHSVLYKYKEGYTNAVRRPVHMKDLL